MSQLESWPPLSQRLAEGQRSTQQTDVTHGWLGEAGIEPPAGDRRLRVKVAPWLNMQACSSRMRTPAETLGSHDATSVPYIDLPDAVASSVTQRCFRAAEGGLVLGFFHKQRAIP